MEKIDKKRMMQTVVTLYYRAKHHPYKTKDMESAMKIFSKWIEKNRKKWKHSEVPEIG